nr:hypothetical protein RMONA_3655 [Rickettsia monacensis IrR/Munich]
MQIPHILQYVKISELILTELLIILQKWDVVLSIGFWIQASYDNQ